MPRRRVRAPRGPAAAARGPPGACARVRSSAYWRVQLPYGNIHFLSCSVISELPRVSQEMARSAASAPPLRSWSRGWSATLRWWCWAFSAGAGKRPPRSGGLLASVFRRATG